MPEFFAGIFSVLYSGSLPPLKDLGLKWLGCKLYCRICMQS